LFEEFRAGSCAVSSRVRQRPTKSVWCRNGLRIFGEMLGRDACGGTMNGRAGSGTVSSRVRKRPTNSVWCRHELRILCEIAGRASHEGTSFITGGMLHGELQSQEAPYQ
jgi:hypothetical protein